MSDDQGRLQLSQLTFLPMREDLPPHLRISEEDFWRDWCEAQPHQRAAILAKLAEHADDAALGQSCELAEVTLLRARQEIERADFAPPLTGRPLESLRVLMSRNAFETMLAPFIAQEREEHHQAMQRGDRGRARWIIVRMYLLISYNALSGIASSLVCLIIKIGRMMGA